MSKLSKMSLGELEQELMNEIKNIMSKVDNITNGDILENIKRNRKIIKLIEKKGGGDAMLDLTKKEMDKLEDSIISNKNFHSKIKELQKELISINTEGNDTIHNVTCKEDFKRHYAIVERTIEIVEELSKLTKNEEYKEKLEHLKLVKTMIDMVKETMV